VRQASTLVLGVGNALLTDEGVGIHVVEHLRLHFPAEPGVKCLDGGTLSFTLAPEVEDAANLIVVDAARLDAPPGTIRVLVGEEMDRFLGTTKCSAHEVGLLDLLRIARLTGRLPERRALVAIQPGSLGWGEQPSERLAATVPQAAAVVLDILRSWQSSARKARQANDLPSI